MDAFSKILGGQMPAEVGNLIDQFNQGVHQNVPDEQVTNSYGQVAAQLPQDQYEAAAADAFSRLTPEQRAQFAQWLRTHAPQHGVSTPAVQQASADPGSLAAATAQV